MKLEDRGINHVTSDQWKATGWCGAHGSDQNPQFDPHFKKIQLADTLRIDCRWKDRNALGGYHNNLINFLFGFICSLMWLDGGGTAEKTKLRLSREEKKGELA